MAHYDTEQADDNANYPLPGGPVWQYSSAHHDTERADNPYRPDGHPIQSPNQQNQRYASATSGIKPDDNPNYLSARPPPQFHYPVSYAQSKDSRRLDSTGTYTSATTNTEQAGNPYYPGSYNYHVTQRSKLQHVRFASANTNTEHGDLSGASRGTYASATNNIEQAEYLYPAPQMRENDFCSPCSQGTYASATADTGQAELSYYPELHVRGDSGHLVRKSELQHIRFASINNNTEKADNLYYPASHFPGGGHSRESRGTYASAITIEQADNSYYPASHFPGGGHSRESRGTYASATTNEQVDNSYYPASHVRGDGHFRESRGTYASATTNEQADNPHYPVPYVQGNDGHPTQRSGRQGEQYYTIAHHATEQAEKFQSGN